MPCERRDGDGHEGEERQRRPRPSFADHILDVCRKEGFLPASQVLAQSAISLVSVGVGLAIVPRSVSASPRRGVAYRAYAGFNPGATISLNVRLDTRAVHVRNFLEAARTFARGFTPRAVTLADPRLTAEHPFPDARRGLPEEGDALNGDACCLLYRLIGAPGQVPPQSSVRQIAGADGSTGDASRAMLASEHVLM